MATPKRKQTRNETPPEIGLPAAVPPAVQSPAAPELVPAESPAVPAVERTVAMEIPMIDVPDAGYCPRRFHVEVHLGRAEAEAFRRMQAALDARHARLRSGKVVQSRADACRWLFEQLANT